VEVINSIVSGEPFTQADFDAQPLNGWEEINPKSGIVRSDREAEFGCDSRPHDQAALFNSSVTSLRTNPSSATNREKLEYAIVIFFSSINSFQIEFKFATDLVQSSR
jgi:hypothetical protein